MKRTVFQHPELRDANDVIIQEGTYGKNSPLANSDNTGGFDYINNNLEALYDMITGSKVYVDSEADLPATGDVAAVYIASDTGVRYYWDPSAKKYVKSESGRKLVNEAIAARDAALASQQAAAASEETAKSARNSAEGSATAAGNSATEAASSASSAGSSATAAQAAASTATTQAENASSRAALASASQTAAKTSETRAAESAKEAARSASQASAYQINADWKETDTNAKAYIKNKPDVVSKSDLNNATAAVTNQLTSKIDKMSETFNTTNLTVTSETSVPTANAGNSSKAIANTEFVAKSLARLVDSAPESLNTLNELAKALGNNPNFASTVLNELAKKLNSTEADDLLLSGVVPISGMLFITILRGPLLVLLMLNGEP